MQFPSTQDLALSMMTPMKLAPGSVSVVTVLFRENQTIFVFDRLTVHNSDSNARFLYRPVTISAMSLPWFTSKMSLACVWILRGPAVRICASLWLYTFKSTSDSGDPCGRHGAVVQSLRSRNHTSVRPSGHEHGCYPSNNPELNIKFQQ